MPKPTKFVYKKKAPFRDAFYFIIICEGEHREPAYFRFFDGLSSRVKVISVPSEEGNSSPKKLISVANKIEEKLGANAQSDRLWFVIDTDRWRLQLHALRQECSMHSHWNVAQSNPCFEVWLYFHVKRTLPTLSGMEGCNKWKSFLPTIIKGGFNSEVHPIAIENAIINS